MGSVIVKVTIPGADHVVHHDVAYVFRRYVELFNERYPLGGSAFEGAIVEPVDEMPAYDPAFDTAFDEVYRR